jgi:FkbM family methyltransferase
MRAAPEDVPSTPFSVEFFGSTYSGDLSNFVDWSVYIYGAYSNNELQLLADISKALRAELEVITFYDVGANVGQHTLFMSKHSDEVVSFEPFEPAWTKLLQKLTENQIKNVRTFPFALGARDEDLTFFAPDGVNLGTGSFLGPNDIESDLKLPVRQGDTFFDVNQLPRIDIMKLDVEGYEAAVFQGLSERIRRDRPIILTEISGADRSGFGNFDGFKNAMYRDFEIFSVGCTSISGTYRMTQPSFEMDGEFLVVPKERLKILQRIVR